MKFIWGTTRFIILKLYHRIHFSGTVFLLLFALAIELAVENMAFSTFNKLGLQKNLSIEIPENWFPKNWMSESCSTGREHVHDFRYIDIG